MKAEKITTSFFSAAFCTVVILSSSGYANAGLEDEMNDMFGSMSNVTSPGAYNSSRRGVLTGGRVQVRNKIMNTDLISLDPPSFEAGCGGINFYGGSFSFINKDKFVQLLRTVASNAAGFAFSIALKAMSNEVAATIETIQKKIQKFNEFFGNSCQLAQGITTGTKSAVQKAWNGEASLGKSMKDGAGDLFESFTKNGNGKAPSDNPDEKTKLRLTGNLVWAALKKHDTRSWWKYGDENMLELIMSASGTIIVGLADTPGGGGSDGPNTKTIVGGSPSLTDLVNGATIQYYKCNNSETCFEPTQDKITIKGYEPRIREMFLGDGEGRKGILTKIQQDTKKLTYEEERFLAALPNGLGGMLYRLSRIDRMMAENFVTGALRTISIQMAYEMADGMFKTVTTALAGTEENAYSGQAESLVQKARGEMLQEHQTLMSKAPKISESLETYNAILQAVGNDYVAPAFRAPGK